jgi:DNA-binding HxlR family transcriptional regulator
MVGTRTYGDMCGVARALDIVGERWALLVVRELLLGPKRFTDLRAGLPKVGPDILSQRLRELELAGVVCRHQLPAPAASWVYELTDRGRELEPVVLALGRWGSRAVFPAEPAAFGPDSAVLALKTLFSPEAADGLEATYLLRFGPQHFTVRISDARLEVQRGNGAAPDAVIETTPAALASLLWNDGRISEMEADGHIKIQGSRPSVQRFLNLFPIPA